MKLTRGQRDTLALIEIRLGHPVPQPLLPYVFAKLDRGVKPPENPDLPFIFQAFRMIAADYKSWVQDFGDNQLSLDDFADAPLSQWKLALKAYEEASKRQ